jgi:hypothetical protein
MQKNDILNEMNLPLDNPNESLETISRNQFRPLFTPEKFEIRDELIRDKGIDFTIEIKKGGKYTNFKFLVQLKATEGKTINADESVSLQLNTPNINYLLNSGMPAFYVLYIKESSIFYYENVNEFVKGLYQTNPDWSKQNSHALRFSKKMGETEIVKMYDTTLKKGIFQRQVNETLVMQSTSVNSGDKILFDANFTVTGDSEIRNLIEMIGLQLINEGKWREILAVHRNASGSIASTAKYNLVLGVANYYNGNLIEALSFLKSADKNKTELKLEIAHFLNYFIAGTKFSLGLMTDQEYGKQMCQLEEADTIGLYVKLEKAKSKYYTNLSDDSKEKFDQFITDINAIITNPNADDAIRITAKCELILVQGSKNNWDNVTNIALLNAMEILTGPNQSARLQSIGSFIAAQSAWFTQVQELKRLTWESKNYFPYFNIIINEVKVTYEMHAFTSIVQIEQKMPGQSEPQRPDTIPFFTDLLQKMEMALHYYQQVGHIENEVVCLCVMYELLHYINDFSKANAVLSDAEQLIDTYELTEKRERLKFLKNNGTTHQRFKGWIDKVFQTNDVQKREFDQMVTDMKNMDELDRLSVSPRVQTYTIELFPIGRFKFPKNKLQTVIEILNIPHQDVQKRFEFLFSFVVPVANILYTEIMNEGPLDGELADQGITSWRNIYRVRKAFHENKFYRHEITF